LGNELARLVGVSAIEVDHVIVGGAIDRIDYCHEYLSCVWATSPCDIVGLTLGGGMKLANSAFGLAKSQGGALR
jgi:hypothetical protein